MKRRDFLQSVVTVPAGAVLFEGTAGAQSPAQAPPAQPAGSVPGQGGTLAMVLPDQMATITPRALSASQLATLRHLSALLMPANGPNPGAVDVQAAEYLDNYLAVSAGDRQRLYREGLDGLMKQSQSRFKQPFAELSAAEADAIVKPLFKVRGPTMSVVELGPFINWVHQDVRTVTINSPQWAAAQAAASNPVPRQLYWRNIDPTVPRSQLAPWQKTTKS